MAKVAGRLFRCSVCGGTFRDPQADGIRYYHACAPLSVAELLALPRLELDALAPGLKADATEQELRDALASRTIERPGKRDENISPSFQGFTLQKGETLDDSKAPIVADNGQRVDLGPA